MKLFHVLSVALLLFGLSFGLTGCGNWKPLGHSISEHTPHHHGTGAKEHKREHPSD